MPRRWTGIRLSIRVWWSGRPCTTSFASLRRTASRPPRVLFGSSAAAWPRRLATCAIGSTCYASGRSAPPKLWSTTASSRVGQRSRPWRVAELLLNKRASTLRSSPLRRHLKASRSRREPAVEPAWTCRLVAAQSPDTPRCSLNQATSALEARSPSSPRKPWAAPSITISSEVTLASSKAALIRSLLLIGTSASWSP